ncbi:MAG TPA: pre-peptidase C-terminal domain-containing protein, partial [Herpetosiphonaceae bacterium]
MRGDIYRSGDVDFFSLPLRSGDRFYAATMTAASASTSGDTVLTLLAPNGTTVIETDDEDGVFNGNASSIAGTAIITGGTYFVRVTGFNASSTQVRYYDLHVKVQSGAPVPETEPNNNGAPQALPASGWVSGVISSTAAAVDNDMFSFDLNAGDTAFLSLDLDPERNGGSASWNGRLSMGAFNNFLLS